MKKYIAIILTLFISLNIAACGNDAKGGENNVIQNAEIFSTNSSPKEDSEAVLETELEPESGIYKAWQGIGCVRIGNSPEWGRKRNNAFP